MEIVSFLSSINKLSLLAFLITLAVLIYEIRLLKKERLFRSKPKIPKFEASINPQIAQGASLIVDNQTKITKSNNVIIIVLIILLIVFGVAAVFGFSNYQKISQSTVSPTPLVNLITSKGIKIFDKDLNPINDSQLSKIHPGDEIIIGVETVKEADIDRARIRVDRDNWQTDDITVDFSTKYQIYYLKYTVATGDAKLKIEAQLHSVSDGWLGE